jgi:multimeric flavodoxin WrbA
VRTLLVVAHAPSPNTQRLLSAILRGARCADFADGVRVIDKPALQAGPDDVRACDAILLFTTENLGYMSGALKDFFDRSYYPVLEEKQGLPCAIVIRAGHDGTGTRRALDSILTGLRWKKVQEPLVLRGDWREEFLAPAEELGMTLAAALDAGML